MYPDYACTHGLMDREDLNNDCVWPNITVIMVLNLVTIQVRWVAPCLLGYATGVNNSS